MSLSIALVALVQLSSVTGQPKGAGIDTALPAAIAPQIAEAAVVERDPKRGPDTAIRRLEAERSKYNPKDPLYMSFRLREAGVFLRKHFLASTNKFTPEERTAQAVSTYTRLDLREPGLEMWLKDGLQYVPKVDKTIEVALLMRGVPTDKKAVQKILAAPFKRLGFRLKFVPAKKAHVVMKLAASDTKATDPSFRAVRMRLDFEGLEDGKVHWRHGVFRTAQAATTDAAVGAGLSWLSGIGGRDLFFHHLNEQWPALGKLSGPADHDHGGHPKPPKTKLGQPKNK